MDKSVSKVTRKFVIRFIIWFLILAVVSTIGVTMVWALISYENIDGDDIEEVMQMLTGLMRGLLISDFIVAFLVTKLSIKGALKKVEVTSENKGSIIKNISIALIIFAILICGVHYKIRLEFFGVVDSDFDIEDIKEFEEEVAELEDDLEESEEELEELLEEYDLYYGSSKMVVEMTEEFLKFWDMAKLYIFDGLFLLIMIPVAKKAIDKKVA